jgi:hypothetical protein
VAGDARPGCGGHRRLFHQPAAAGLRQQGQGLAAGSNPRTRGTEAGRTCRRRTTRFLHRHVMPMSLALPTLRGFPPEGPVSMRTSARFPRISLLALLIAPHWTPWPKHRRAMPLKRAAVRPAPSTRCR